MNRSVLHGAAAHAPAADSVAAVVHRFVPLLALLTAAALPARAAPAFELPTLPLILQTSINPNVLVMFDNSQSMDATMAGKMILGSDPRSRSFIARDVLSKVITTYRYRLNWGLGSFEYIGAPALLSTWAYYLGSDSTVVYTNTCENIVDGVGTSDKMGTYTKVVDGVPSEVTDKLPCVTSPVNRSTKASANGFGFLTYARSSDNADVNDVYYQPTASRETEIYGIGSIAKNYRLYTNRKSGTTGWTRSDFSTCSGFNRSTVDSDCGETVAAATDAGFVPDASKYQRLFMLPRALGYQNNITGAGKIDEAVVSSQPSTSAQVDAEEAHFTRLKALLDTQDTSTSLKNAAIFTPLAGALKTSRNYFSTASMTPVTASCQRNYVVLATDGNPTANTEGKAYDASERTNTKDATTGLWTFGRAVEDVLKEIDELKKLKLLNDSNLHGVPTYVIGMGDSVTNPSSVAALNEMAQRGNKKNAYLATSPESLAAAFDDIAKNIPRGDSAAAPVVLNSTSYRKGSTLYQPKFDGSTWTGDLSAFTIDGKGGLATTATWSASTQITAQNWNTGRVLLTYKPSTTAGVAFRWPVDSATPTASEIDAAQVTALNINASSGVADGFGAARLEYLRGNASREVRNCPTCMPRFHNRTTVVDGTVGNVLGDIVNSAPLYVGPPDAGYDNSVETVSYSAFVADHKNRKPYIYVGANDGMLHAIDASTGNEKFAYVPNLVFSKLSRQTVASYDHQYTVDGSPVVRDVFYGGAWHSLLVSGLNAGGKGLFALDVTDPSNVTETSTSAASVVRWEVSDPGLGHVFSQPALVKTNDGKWSVIVANGYNAGTPTAQLFVIDAQTGVVTRKLDTGIGSTASPNGLSGVAPVDTDGDGKIDAVYGGDLDGNLWKFDLKAASAASWAVAFSGSPLFAAGAGKPITARPDVGLHPRGGLVVAFATGRYLVANDVDSTGTQTAYGIWDKPGSTTAVADTELQQQVIQTSTTVSNNDVFRFSTHRVGAARDTLVAADADFKTTLVDFYANKRGWYFDLPTSGERVVFEPIIRGGRAIFTSIIPTVSATCEPGGTSWIMEVDLITGNRLGTATFNTNIDSLVNDEDFLKATASATGTTNTTGWKIDGLATLPRFLTVKVENSTNTVEIKYVNTSSGKVVQKREGPGSSGERRVMWRAVQ